MIELWVRPSGLRRGYDPNRPELTDIVSTPELIRLADRIILCSSNGRKFVRKGDGMKQNFPYWTPVEFNPTRVYDQLRVMVDETDMVKVAEMRKALQNDYLGGNTDAPNEGPIHDEDGPCCGE